MPTSADCQNTQSVLGRNLTPATIVQAVRDTLGCIELDPASDAIANKVIGAERFYSFKDDGYAHAWRARTLFLNAPGKTVTGATPEVRLDWLKTLQSQIQPRPRHALVRTIKAAQWYKKLYTHYVSKNVDEAIGLVYRSGSIGSLGHELLSSASLCLTCSGVDSPIINGSGRLSFELESDGTRSPQTSNTQSSLIFLLSRYSDAHQRFAQIFSQFGVVVRVS